MDCSKVGSLVFFGLMIMTAGFVLTLAGWFAPAIKSSVVRVRTAGPSMLLIGLMMLILSCIICSIQQRRCSRCCLGCILSSKHHDISPDSLDSYDKDLPGANHVIQNQCSVASSRSPLLLRQMDDDDAGSLIKNKAPVKLHVIPQGSKVLYKTYDTKKDIEGNIDRSVYSPEFFTSRKREPSRSSPRIKCPQTLPLPNNHSQPSQKVTFEAQGDFQNQSSLGKQYHHQHEIWHIDHSRSPPTQRQSKHWPMFADYEQHRELDISSTSYKNDRQFQTGPIPNVGFGICNDGITNENASGKQSALCTDSFLLQLSQPNQQSHLTNNSEIDSSAIFINKFDHDMKHGRYDIDHKAPHGVNIACFPGDEQCKESVIFHSKFKERDNEHQEMPCDTSCTQTASQHKHLRDSALHFTSKDRPNQDVCSATNRFQQTTSHPSWPSEAVISGQVVLLKAIPNSISSYQITPVLLPSEKSHQAPGSPSKKRARSHTDLDGKPREIRKAKRSHSPGIKNKNAQFCSTSSDSLKPNHVTKNENEAENNDQRSAIKDPQALNEHLVVDSVVSPSAEAAESNEPEVPHEFCEPCSSDVPPGNQSSPFLLCKLSQCSPLMKRKQSLVLPRPGNNLSYHHEMEKLYPANNKSASGKSESPILTNNETSGLDFTKMRVMF